MSAGSRCPTSGSRCARGSPNRPKIIPTQLEFVDIAGLVRGASKGQGLGNQFLGHLRDADAIAHLLRCFEDDNVVHVEGSVDPIRDAETVETELMLADLDSLERRAVAAQKRARGGEREAKAQLEVMEPVLAALRDGRPARLAAIPADRQRELEGAATVDREADPLHRQCRRGERGRGNRGEPPGRRIRRRAGGAGGDDRGGDRGRARRARGPRTSGANSSPRSASPRPGSTRSSGPAMRCST